MKRALGSVGGKPRERRRGRGTVYRAQGDCLGTRCSPARRYVCGEFFLTLAHTARERTPILSRLSHPHAHAGTQLANGHPYRRGSHTHTHTLAPSCGHYRCPTEGAADTTAAPTEEPFVPDQVCECFSSPRPPRPSNSRSGGKGRRNRRTRDTHTRMRARTHTHTRAREHTM